MSSEKGYTIQLGVGQEVVREDFLEEVLFGPSLEAHVGFGQMKRGRGGKAEQSRKEYSRV